MSFEKVSTMIPATHCEAVRADFSAYLDNEMSGVEMGVIGQHLQDCEDCAAEFAELAANAAPVSADDDAEIVFPRKEPNYAARASKQQRAFELVRVIPKAVSIEPFDARQPGGTVNAQPIRGIVQREVALCPIDA